MSANERQIGGSHYQSAMQHWDFVEDHGIGYLEGCASKYVTRWRRKDGVEGLEKAAHFLEKVIDLHRSTGRRNRGTRANPELLRRFCAANDLGVIEFAVLVGIFNWVTEADLQMALRDLQLLIKFARNASIEEATELADEDGTGMKNPFGYTRDDEGGGS